MLAAFPPDSVGEAPCVQLDRPRRDSRWSTRMVVGIDAQGVEAEVAGRRAPSGSASRTVVWAAGVVGGEPGRAAGERRPAPRSTAPDGSRSSPTSRSPGHPEVLALGDMVLRAGEDGEIQNLPGVAPVAMQQGRYAARVVVPRLGGQRDQAVPLAPTRATWRRSGAPAPWPRSSASTSAAHSPGCCGSGIHIFYLIGFQNRLLVLLRWSLTFPHPRAGSAPDDRGWSSGRRSGVHTQRVEAPM